MSERLVGELHRELILVVLAGADARLDRAVFRLGVDVDEGGERGHALGDLVFEEEGKAAVEVLFGRFALEPVERVPLLLQRAGPAHLEDVRAQRVGSVGVGMRVDPSSRGHDGGFDHVADRQGVGVFVHGHDEISLLAPKPRGRESSEQRNAVMKRPRTQFCVFAA